jgi:hypothetical protein
MHKFVFKGTSTLGTFGRIARNGQLTTGSIGWRIGKTVEEARRELIGVMEEWVFLGIRLGHPLPLICERTVNAPQETDVVE